MIIQVIGLPGVGKSYAISEYLKNTKYKVNFIDCAKYNSNTKTRNKELRRDILKIGKQNIIIESACGFQIKDSIVIKYKKNIQQTYANFLKREKYIDTDYMSLLEEVTISPNYTVKSKQTMHTLLDYFLNNTKRS